MMSSITTTNIYLLRHGKVNGLPALYGHTDIDVSDTVNNTILAELNAFQKNSTNKITHVVSSPLQRCYKVAQQFSVHNNLQFNVEENFKEMYFGTLDGLSFDDIRSSKTSDKTWHQLEQFWHNPSLYPLPDAENLFAFYERVATAWKSLLTTHQGKNILLICHGGVIRMILSLLLKIDQSNQALFSQLTIKNSSITFIKNLTEKHCNDAKNALNHSNVVCISTPLKCIAQNPEAF